MLVLRFRREVGPSSRRSSLVVFPSTLIYLGTVMPASHLGCSLDAALITPTDPIFALPSDLCRLHTNQCHSRLDLWIRLPQYCRHHLSLSPTIKGVVFDSYPIFTGLPAGAGGGWLLHHYHRSISGSWTTIDIIAKELVRPLASIFGLLIINELL